MTELYALLYQDCKEKIENVTDLKALEKIRLEILGKKGQLTLVMKDLGSVELDQRKSHGIILNQIKDKLEFFFHKRKEFLENQDLNYRLMNEKVDITLPARPFLSGKIHPISQTIFEMYKIFASLGFEIAEGTDIEDDFYNFTALNIAVHHPARQDHDTFYLPQVQEKNYLLRTHTSPVQIRIMKTQVPPVRIIAPGRVFRCDSDMTHTPMFHQMEGLYIDKRVNMGHLKGCILEFCERFFGVTDLPVRFRPSYFPFTEPSAEVDIGCRRSDKGIEIGKGKDWLEILGCGMVHPTVLEHGGIDSSQYQGFAFGMGVERLTMLKHSIPDLRTFYQHDQRWIQHFGFPAYQ